MLGDVKSFFTKSSVGEVGVGLTIGAAFTNVMSEATEVGRGLLSGDVDYAGLVQAVIALLAAAFFSIVLVVKPLARFKAMADRSQVDLVARAAGEEATVTAPLAEEGGDDGLVADTSADPTIGFSDEAVPVSGEAAAVDPNGAVLAAEGADAEVLGAVGLAEADTPLTADSVAVEPGVAVDDLPVASTSLAPGASASNALDAWAGDGESDRLERVPSGAVGGDAEAVDLRPEDAAAAPAAAELPTVLRASPPHSHQVTKVCPYCAFDIPAVASRCGYCTADLTDAQRVAGVVLVDQAPPAG